MHRRPAVVADHARVDQPENHVGPAALGKATARLFEVVFGKPAVAQPDHFEALLDEAIGLGLELLSLFGVEPVAADPPPPLIGELQPVGPPRLGSLAIAAFE